MENPVLLSVKDHVAQITLNQPRSMNAMTAALCAALYEAVEACEKNGEVRAVVLTGTGRAFCAGGDLRALEGFTDADEAAAYVRDAGRAAAAIFHSAKPYIAMVNGAAAGAGFNLAIACDFVFASSEAKFTQAFSSVGLVSDCGGNYLLPYLVGPMRAKELMMLPRTLTAAEAERLGVVGAVAEPEALAKTVAAFAEALSSRPPRALAGIKRLVNQGSRLSFDETLREEEETQGRLIVGADAKEGIAAFFGKRAPVFTGES